MTTTIDGSNSVTINSGAILGITSSTAVASTSGTSIDFTSIPSWVKRITVMLNGVSTNGASNFLAQIGAGSVTSTGYVSSTCAVQSAGVSAAAATSTAGFLLLNASAAGGTYIYSGAIQILNFGSNSWLESGLLTSTSGERVSGSSGTVTLSGTLDRIRITTVNGTDTFDAGSINILYE
jgi:hypothetical protein